MANRDAVRAKQVGKSRGTRVDDLGASAAAENITKIHEPGSESLWADASEKMNQALADRGEPLVRGNPKFDGLVKVVEINRREREAFERERSGVIESWVSSLTTVSPAE